MLAAIWMTACGAAVLLSGAEPAQAAIPAVPGAAAALAAPLQPGAWRLVTILTVPLAAAAGLAVLPWAMAGASLVLLAGLAPARRMVLPSRDPQQHIMWCRRQESSADVMLMQVPTADLSRVDALLDAARTTDSLSVRRCGQGFEIVGVMDTEGEKLDRDAVETRLTRQLDGVQPTFGWASFPDDGFTLDLLVEQARGVPEAPAGKRLGRVLTRSAQRRPLAAAFSRANSSE